MAEQLAAARLVQPALVEPAAQDVQLGGAEGALDPEQELVVMVGRVIQAVLVGQQGAEDGADFQELMPVLVGACQAAHLQAEDDADLVEGDGGEQALEAEPAHGGLAALPLILVDNLDLVARPAQGHGLLDEGVLPRGGLLVFEDLLQGGLAHVDDGRAPVVLGPDLGGAD